MAVEPVERVAQVRVIEFPGREKPDGMWSALYAASSGKVYTGLCTHGGSALFFEYDPATDRNRLVADIGLFLGENGRGERTHGKIHTRFAEDSAGNIYFATGNQGSGPSRIDPWTWANKGALLFRYVPDENRVETVGLVTENWGAYGLVLDRRRNIAYLSCFDGHLYAFDLESRVSRDLGRINNWDVNRMIAMDGSGNVYGTYGDHQLWKYAVREDRIFDLSLQIPAKYAFRHIYRLGRPVMDRRYLWRYAEWVPSLGKIYGMEGGRSLLFEFDPHAGEEGTVRLIADMALKSQIESGNHPYSPLAVGFGPDNMAYYALVDRVFDYGAGEHATQSSSHTYLQSCNLVTGEKQMLGRLVSLDGRNVLGTGACEVAADGKVYLCGALEERDPERVAGKAAGVDPFRLQLMVWEGNHR